MANAGEVSMLLLSYCYQKIQDIEVELLLGYLDKCINFGMDLENNHVTHLIVMQLFAIACVKLIVSFPLDT